MNLAAVGIDRIFVEIEKLRRKKYLYNLPGRLFFVFDYGEKFA